MKRQLIINTSSLVKSSLPIDYYIILQIIFEKDVDLFNHYKMTLDGQQALESLVRMEYIKYTGNGYIYEDLLKGADLPVGTPGTVVNSEAFKDVGGFDENLFGFVDYDLFFRLAKDWTVHFLNEPLILFHHHLESRVSDTTQRRERDFRIFMEKWRNEIIRVGGKESFHDMVSKRVAGHYFSAVRGEVINKGRISALKFLCRSFSWHKFRFFYFIKNLLIIIVGPRIWDFLKKGRGEIYWKWQRK